MLLIRVVIALVVMAVVVAAEKSHRYEECSPADGAPETTRYQVAKALRILPSPVELSQSMGCCRYLVPGGGNQSFWALIWKRKLMGNAGCHGA